MAPRPAHRPRRRPASLPRASRLVLALTAALGLATAPGPVEATYPGDPGRLSFGMDVGGNVDVYSVWPGGFGLSRLTSGAGFDACSAWSPDGRRVAYCGAAGEDLEIWTVGTGGRNHRQVTALGGVATFPDFSPDARRIAFMWNEGPGEPIDIWTVGADGRDARPLTHTPDRSEGFPVHDPSGRWIAFLRTPVGQSAPEAPGTQLWVMDADGGNERRLTADDAQKTQLPDWHPRGDRIAYVADGDIWTIRPDGTDREQVTHTPELTEVGATWSPTGRRLATLGLEDRRVRTLRADGTDVRVVLPTGGPQFVPAWQPRDLAGR